VLGGEVGAPQLAAAPDADLAVSGDHVVKRHSI
jgi:hypothetical protein